MSIVSALCMLLMLNSAVLAFAQDNHPPFKFFKMKLNEGISLVVPVSTSDAQPKRRRSLARLKLANWKNTHRSQEQD